MAKVVDIEQAKVDRLADELQPLITEALTTSGLYMVPVAEIDDVERWRRAARKCGRRLGLRIRTGTTTNGERAWIVHDRQTNELEDQVLAARLGSLRPRG